MPIKITDRCSDRRANCTDEISDGIKKLERLTDEPFEL